MTMTMMMTLMMMMMRVTYLSTLPAVVEGVVVVTPWMHSAVHWAPPPNFFLSVMNITCTQTHH